ncbi:MAG: hypothetical protein SGJ20_05055 [Planctomycetota bacterium]|nr:hypothetical protein [Planctomycetota bacterium]
MSILDILRAQPTLLEEKSIKQLISIAGNGKLTDGSTTCAEFRELLGEVPAERIVQYADECLKEGFQDSGLALQDIINEVGRRLGFGVTYGRYRGRTGAIGNDGLWELPNGHKIVVEVKTTDAYRIDLNVIAAYRRELVLSGVTSAEDSSVLVVVGRTDTGDLEAQIRGSRHAWEMRLISVDALVRLMLLKQSVEDPDALRRIYEILIPREFTKLDEIVELVFSTAEDAKQVDDILETDDDQLVVESAKATETKFAPVAFNALIAENVSRHLGTPLLKRTRALFSSPDESVRVVCAASRAYTGKAQQNYWFAFHPHQKEALEGAQRGFAAFGCGSPMNTFLIPMETFNGWLEGMNMTLKEERPYWHVQIYEEDGKPTLVRKKGVPRIDLTRYHIPVSVT